MIKPFPEPNHPKGFVSKNLDVSQQNVTHFFLGGWVLKRAATFDSLVNWVTIIGFFQIFVRVLDRHKDTMKAFLIIVAFITPSIDSFLPIPLDQPTKT